MLDDNNGEPFHIIFKTKCGNNFYSNNSYYEFEFTQHFAMNKKVKSMKNRAFVKHFSIFPSLHNIMDNTTYSVVCDSG